MREVELTEETRQEAEGPWEERRWRVYGEEEEYALGSVERQRKGGRKEGKNEKERLMKPIKPGAKTLLGVQWLGL